MAEYVIPFSHDYGAPELKKNYRKYLSRGLILAAIFHFVLVGSYWLSVYLTKEEPPARTIRILKYSELGPPPSITDASTAVAPAVSVASPSARPSIGIPVPVPDAEVNPEETFATQQELSQVVGPVKEGAGTGGGQQVIEQDLKIENDEEAPPDFVPFEKAPVIVKRVEPIYPEIAQKSGLEGTVWVKMWVDKEGKVKEVVILKSDSEIFDENVKTAAKQWIFTPALMKTGPVSVWISMHFSFEIKKQ